MSAATITPLEALRRLIAEVKQLDAVEVGARWNQLQGELGVAEGVVRDWKEPVKVAAVRTSDMIYGANHPEYGFGWFCTEDCVREFYDTPVAVQPAEPPIAYLRFRAAQQWSGNGNHDVEHNEWLETCHAHEVGDDKLPAFPVYAARQIAAVSAAPSGEVERDACPVWISVDARMPDDNQKVIVLYWPFDNHENAQVAGEAEHIQGVFYTDEGDDHHCPSHWSPMPVLPVSAITATNESK